MGNKTAGLKRDKSPAPPNEINIDDIDESKTNLKENKKTRKSKEYKSIRDLARSGIADEDRFELWRKASNTKDKYVHMYQDIKSELFCDIDMNEFPQFPRFGSACTFDRLRERSVQSTEEHKNSDDNLLHASQRILLTLAMEHDALKYCPQLGYIVERMLLDANATESGVFAICHAMLTASKRNNWYFRTDYFNTHVRIKTFLSIFADNVSAIAQSVRNKNFAIEFENMMGDAISSMFVKYLNAECYQRIIDCFSVEGYKVLFRVGVALLNNAQSQLLACEAMDAFKKLLITESKKLSADELCRRSFKIYLTRNKFDKLDKLHREKEADDALVNKVENETYVRRWPSWNKQILSQSNILTKKIQFLQLWVWLPPGCHIGDYTLLFSTQNDGYQLSTLYQQCQQRQHLIVIIKTTANDIIGFFVSQFDDDENDKCPPLKTRLKDPKILLFQLDANHAENNKNRFRPKCYYADVADQYYHQSNFELQNMRTSIHVNSADDNENKVNENEDADGPTKIPVVFPSKESLTVGDGEQNAIFIDADLNQGISSPCHTFNAPSLVAGNGEFQVSQIEVWCVV